MISKTGYTLQPSSGHRIFTTAVYLQRIQRYFRTFLREPHHKYNVEDTEFINEDTEWLQTALGRHSLDFSYEYYEIIKARIYIFNGKILKLFAFKLFEPYQTKSSCNVVTSFAVWHNATN